MILAKNIPSLNTQRNLSIVIGKQTKSSERLSTGLRINRAADDAAGLAITEKMRGQIRGLNQAGRNIQDGVSLLSVADGALQEAQNIVHRMRELAVQACNDTNSGSDRKKLDEEYKQLCTELEDIAQNTEFNTKKLFTGDYAEKVLTEVVVDWLNVIEADPFNTATSSAPTIAKRSAPSAALAVGNLSRTGSINAFPNESLTPKAQVITTSPRPPRDLPGTADDLTGDKWYTSGTVAAADNIGAKIVAEAGTDELNVNDNTSYKNNIDGSWNKWQGQKQIRVLDTSLPGYYDTNNNWQTGTGKYIWGSWDENGNFREDRWVDEPTMVETVGTIEDHSEYGHDGLIAGTPKDWEDTATTKYRWSRVLDFYQPTDKRSTGDTDWDYEHDEWERAEIYSEATITNVKNNNGGAIYVRNSDSAAKTHVVNNSANMNYNLAGVSPPYYPQAIVDTNTYEVTVENNSDDATVISRNQEAGSKFTSTINKSAVIAGRGTVRGKIYSGAETTTVTTNNGELYVDSNGSTNSSVNVTTNSGIVYADSHIAQIGSNTGTIAQLDLTNTGSQFNLTGTNSGYVRTDAENVTVNVNSGSLVTTNTLAASTLNVTTNTGTIDTGVANVTITNNRGYLRLGNSTATATISSTTTGSVIDTYAQQLTINGTANGSIRVESGATVTINGTNNAKVSILNGGTVNVTNLGGTTIVETGATLNITGDITGTLYIQAGANVSFSGELKGTVVFLGEPASFSPNPFDVAAGGIVELQNTKSINIGVNNGTVNMFNSNAEITDNKGTLQVNSDAAVTSISSNSGTILNLGEIDANGATNTGIIKNWNQTNSPFTNAGGTITHYLPFAEDNNTYDVSGVKIATATDGKLVPDVQESVIKVSYNSQDYTLTAQWQPTNTNNDVSLVCTCTAGAHDKTGCSDHDAGLIADVFELVFNIDNVVPPLQAGENFVFLSNPSLNTTDMSYDIIGRTVVYNVDYEASLREEWEDGDGLWMHTGANTHQGYNVYLPDLTKSMSDITINCAICDCGSLKAADLLNHANAEAALGLCDTTNSNISKVRGYIGAQINGLTYAGNNAAISSENLSSAESRMRDANIAKEIMINTKNDILSQVGMSLLAQSNKNPQIVLELLR